jgi:hypothetical protein
LRIEKACLDKASAMCSRKLQPWDYRDSHRQDPCRLSANPELS